MKRGVCTSLSFLIGRYISIWCYLSVSLLCRLFHVEEASVEDTALWLSARNSEAAKAYGPQWKTLGLQDRGVWDEDNILHFPRTVSLIKELNVPSCEAFFAKQGTKE